MFTVRFIDESALPPEHLWVIGVDGTGERFLFIKEGAVLASVIEDAWAGGIRLNEPALRVAV